MENVDCNRQGATGPHMLFVMSGLGVGGTERQVALLAAELVRSGFSVTIYSLSDGEMREQFERAGARVIVASGRLGSGSTFRVKLAYILPFTALRLFWIMLTRRPAIVHFFLPAAYLLGAPLAVVACVPIRVMSRRSLNDYQRNSVIRKLESGLHRLMHAVVGNARAIVYQLREEGVPPSRLGLIYNGINAEVFAAAGSKAENRRRLGLRSTTVVMCTIANLIPYKGHRNLIGALELAAPDLPSDWQLLVVGRDDGIGAELKAEVSKLGLQDHILFLGARSDVAAILLASDIGMLCSQGNEGFSNAILEGMAAGLPMIVTDVGGNAEAVIDRETGFVVPAGDLRKLAAAIVELANAPELRAKFGQAGKCRVTECFSLDRCIERHKALYKTLLAGGKPADIVDLNVEP